ncbi:MAG: 50S ribosome-binding GTPase, partial [Planctomycetota bacterium]|nr:50S ribosome-binding GTPase [Planctomycetota bacterium]
MIRISGEGAFGVASGALCAPDAIVAVRGVQRIRASVLGHAVGGLAMVMPGPRSFTGEDVVELHLPGSPLLLAQVGAALVAAGARHAAPGEFTRRAFEHGRLTLSEAEAVLDLIRAADVESARRAAAVLDGGIDRAVGGIRSAILDARAMLEAGLDFEEGETGDVEPEIWRAPLRRVAAQLDALAAEQPVGPGASDLVLLGPANAGKSSLCNALLGRDEFLVSDVPGTTRDVLEIELPGGGRLWDAPGDLGEGAAGTDAEALALRARLLGAAGGSLV